MPRTKEPAAPRSEKTLATKAPKVAKSLPAFRGIAKRKQKVRPDPETRRTENLVPRSVSLRIFKRSVGDLALVSESEKNRIRITPQAKQDVRDVTENVFLGILTMARRWTAHADRVTMKPQDVSALAAMFHECQFGDIAFLRGLSAQLFPAAE